MARPRTPTRSRPRAAGERLRFNYAGHDGMVSVRDVEPYSLVYTGRRWYLLGWDTDRADWRTFRADRIQPRVPTGPRFAPREPPGGDAVAHVLRGVGSAASPHPALVRLHASAETMAQRIPTTAGLLEAIDERACLLHTDGESLGNPAAFFGILEVDFDVLDPPDLRAVIRRPVRAPPVRAGASRGSPGRGRGGGAMTAAPPGRTARRCRCRRTG
ncbi:WYL domain-containing protein [Micromonospora parva]|uniref:WYL domain-containing protein n=1 Tax=Micromonospora parva TaxID=1464048 RepID=UPI0033F469DD